MNLTKKLFSYIVAIAMIFTLTAFAGGAVNAADTETYTLTLQNDGKTAHTFDVYQVFTGDLNGSTLSNIQWGSGITETGKTELGTASENAKKLEGQEDDSADAREFAEKVQQYLTDPFVEKEVAAGNKETVTVDKAGYYLIKDKLKNDSTSTQDGVKEGATTAYILKIVGNTTAKTKLDIPTVKKKVQDTNDSTGKSSDWQDSADYDIGDYVPYQITGTMPANIDAYTSYKYVFTDTMSKGLTYEDLSAEEKNLTIKIGDTVVTGSFTEKVEKNENGSTTVTWSCDNLKDAGVKLTPKTEVVVTYNAKLNDNAVIGSTGNDNTVNLTYSNNPNKGGKGETGKTPDDKNIVFTYKAVVNKVDQENKPLAGAGFTLQKEYKNVNGTTEYRDVTTIEASDKTTTFEFKGLDDGNYKLIESTTPEGYNTIAPITFTVSAEHDVNSDNPTLTSLTGKKSTGEILFTSKIDDGSLTTDVINNKGSVLPETGGMGTTLLYAVGGVLVALAAAYIIISKKHEKAE